MTYSSFDIKATWAPDGMTPGELAERVSCMLRALEPLSPAMTNWVIGDQVQERWVTLREASVDFPGLVRGNMVRDDWGARPENGYRVGIKGSQRPSAFSDSNSVHLSVTAGSRFNNSVSFEVGVPSLARNFDLTTYPLYKDVLRVLADVWPLPWGFASTYDSKFERGRKRARTPFDLAWIGYLSAPLAERLVPPKELIVERTPGGEALISAVEVLIDQSNSEHVARSRLLEEILINRVGYDPRLFRPKLHPARGGRW